MNAKRSQLDVIMFIGDKRRQNCHNSETQRGRGRQHCNECKYLIEYGIRDYQGSFLQKHNTDNGERCNLVGPPSCEYVCVVATSGVCTGILRRRLGPLTSQYMDDERFTFVPPGPGVLHVDGTPCCMTDVR